MFILTILSVNNTLRFIWLIKGFILLISYVCMRVYFSFLLYPTHNSHLTHMPFEKQSNKCKNYIHIKTKLHSKCFKKTSWILLSLRQRIHFWIHFWKERERGEEGTGPIPDTDAEDIDITTHWCLHPRGVREYSSSDFFFPSIKINPSENKSRLIYDSITESLTSSCHVFYPKLESSFLHSQKVITHLYLLKLPW